MSYKYQLIEVLGEGGFGVVYRARQVALGREVACKVARRELLEDDTALIRFHREMRICAALSHPNIVKVFDFGQLGDGRLFFAMELLDATELGTVVKQTGPLGVDDAVSYLSQAADALAYVHARNMVHRDIKPSNLMVDRAGRLVVMDFSVVWIDERTRLTQTGGITGTLPYLPPEILGGQQTVLPSLDVYSLGVTFWEALAGQRLFGGQSLRKVIEDIRTKRAAPIRSLRADVPEWLSDILCRTLSVDPAERPSSLDIVQACRQHRMSAQRVRASPTTQGPTSGRRVDSSTIGRGRRPRAIAASVLVAVLISITLWWLAFHRERSIPEEPRGSGWAMGGRPIRLARASFPGFRRMSIDLEGDLVQGSTFEFRDGQRTVGRGTLGSSRRAVVFERLPTGIAGRVVALRPGGQVAAASLDVRLPRVVPVEEFQLVPSDRSVLVDFALPEALPVTVALHRVGENNPEPAHVETVRGTVFHRVFKGLRPATEYLVRVSSQGAWMGLADYPFTTLDEAHRRLRETWVSQLESHLSGYEDILFADRPELDPALLNPMLSHFRRTPPATERSFEFLIWLAEHLRSPELAEILYQGRPGPTDDPASLALALMRARHPKAAQVAGELFASASSTDALTRLAEVLSACGGPETCDLIAERRDRVKDWWLSPEWLTRLDRSRAREHFERWLRADPLERNSRVHFAVGGFSRLGDEAALQTLRGCLSAEWARPTRIAAAWELGGKGGPGARELLSRVVRQDPDPFDFLWPFVRCATNDDAPVFESLLGRSKEWRARGTAALALGHLRAGTSAPALRKALEDPDPRVVTAASWATGRLRDRAAGPLLERLVTSGRDGAGVAAHALGEIDHRAAVQTLRTSLQVRLERQAAIDLASLGPVALALDTLTDGKARDQIETAIAAARVPALAQRFVRRLLARQKDGRPSASRVVLPQETFIRTGITCYPGDWVEIDAHGYWSRGREGSPRKSVTAHLQVPDAERPELSFYGLVGDQHWNAVMTPRCVVQCEGELELWVHCGKGSDGLTDTWSNVCGSGIVAIRTSAEGSPEPGRFPLHEFVEPSGRATGPEAPAPRGRLADGGERRPPAVR